MSKRHALGILQGTASKQNHKGGVCLLSALGRAPPAEASSRWYSKDGCDKRCVQQGQWLVLVLSLAPLPPY